MKQKITLLLLSVFFFSQAYAQCDGATFEERNGIAVIEMESIGLASGWRKESHYIAWRGADSFSKPGVGTTTYKVKINNAGTYRFVWRNKIGIIASHNPSTEHNDAWLKIQASNFFGKDGSGIIYPGGSGKSPTPNGASSGGWFKVYTNTINWSWATNTSDHDPHQIYATFSKPGVYNVQISGRSNGHLIDRMVLFNESKVSYSSATSLSRSQTKCSGGSTPTPDPDPVPDPDPTPSPSNTAPTVSFKGLSNGQTVKAGSDVSIDLNANDKDGSISKHEIFVNNTKVDTDGSRFTPHVISDIKAGSYTIKATVTDNGGKTATKSITIKAVQDTPTNPTPDPEPEPEPDTNSDITSVDYINGDADKVLGKLVNGTEISLAAINNAELSFRANTSGSVGSVKFALTGPRNFSKTDSRAPYTLVGDNGSDFYGISLPAGNYTLKATTYSGSNGSGTKGETSTTTFSVVKSGGSTPTAPTNEAITLTLVDALGTDKNIGTISDGSSFSSGKNVSVKLTTTYKNASLVIFTLTGATKKTTYEGSAPYSLFGDIGVDLVPGNFNNGSHKLVAKVYAGSTLLGQKTVNFTVGGSAKTASSKQVDGGDVVVYPNPISNGEFNVKLPANETEFTYQILTVTGNVVGSGNGTSSSPIQLSSQAAAAIGVNYVVIQTNSNKYTVPVVIE